MLFLQTCSGCRGPGATLGCLLKGCPSKYHYHCALEAGKSYTTPTLHLHLHLHYTYRYCYSYTYTYTYTTPTLHQKFQL